GAFAAVWNPRDLDDAAGRELDVLDHASRRGMSVWCFRRERVVCRPRVDRLVTNSHVEAGRAVVLVEVSNDDRVSARAAVERRGHAAWAWQSALHALPAARGLPRRDVRRRVSTVAHCVGLAATGIVPGSALPVVCAQG